MKIAVRRILTTKNSELINSIKTLKSASRKSGKKIWGTIAQELNKSKRRRVSVNLSNINRNTTEGQVVAIPGKVLATGHLTHPVTIAAFSFSKQAIKKITNAQGRAISLTELWEEGVEPSQITIIK